MKREMTMRRHLIQLSGTLLLELLYMFLLLWVMSGGSGDLFSQWINSGRSVHGKNLSTLRYMRGNLMFVD